MNQALRARVLKTLRTLHAWLGILIFPWILIVGLTGFYLNHAKAVLSFIEPPAFDESTFADWPDPVIADRGSSLAMARAIWPESPPQKFTEGDYHGRPSFTIDTAAGQLIVSEATGHYFIKAGFTRKTFAPDGTKLDSKVYWSTIFKTLHVRGWLNNSVGTWIADITSIALVLFASSGIFLWWMPRAKKFARALKRS